MVDNEECLPEKSSSRLVLVVEDDASIGEFIVELIKEEDQYQATLVSDGFHTLQFVQHIKPDLLLLDYQLPGMNGIELYDRLCQVEELKDIPTLFISANPPLAELEKRHLLCIKKPFELDELLTGIKQLLE